MAAGTSHRQWLALPILAVSLGTGLADAADPAMPGGALLMAIAGDPGPNEPPAGASLFDRLYRAQDGQYELPFPFEAFLADLGERSAPSPVRTALIPLGRSLQRYAADPDYFASPRIVAAMDSETAVPNLKDRLYLGYQPAAGAIEVISFNEAAGRYEFQEITGYTEPGAATVHYSERAVCTACHQGHAPIFATALWTESNGNRAVADRLSSLGESFHGAPVRQGTDATDFFDRSTDRATRIQAAARLWQHGCAATEDPASCRADLLLAGFRYRLGGERGLPSDGPWRRHPLSTRWPEGLLAPSPDIPNRDPLAAMQAGASPVEAIDASGAFDPTTPRAPVEIWRSGTSPGPLIASLFSDADIAWLDERLSTIQPYRTITARTRCPVRRALDGELRFACESRPLAVTGHFRFDDGTVTEGHLRHLRVAENAPVSHLDIVSGSAVGSGPLRLELRESARGMTPRLATGERLSHLQIALSGNGMAILSVEDDITPLADAIAAMTDALADGPPVPSAILAELDESLPR